MKNFICAILFLILIFPICAEDNLNKPLITVMDFETNNISATDMTIIVDYLASYIVETGKYRVIERSQREKILQEMEFSLSGCTDDSCQLEIGKLLAADLMVLGSLGVVEGKTLLNMRVIDVESGETMNTISREFSSLSEVIDTGKSVIFSFLEEELDLLQQQKEAALKLFQREMQKKYDNLLKEVDKNKFYSWAGEQNYLDIYNSPDLAERAALLDSYIKYLQVSGFSLNIAASISFGSDNNNILIDLSETFPELPKLSYEKGENFTGAGISISVPFTFENFFSVGIWGNLIAAWKQGSESISQYDEETRVYESIYSTGIQSAGVIPELIVNAGIMAGYGDIIRGAAFRCGIGYGFLGFTGIMEMSIKRLLFQMIISRDFISIGAGGVMLPPNN